MHQSGESGNPHILVLTDKSLHNLKLDGFCKNITNHKKYPLLEITTVQNGYISKTDPSSPLDAIEVNTGNFAIRFYIGTEYHKTFKCPDATEPDDMHKGTHNHPPH